MKKGYMELDNIDSRIRSVSLVQNKNASGYKDLGNVLLQEKRIYYEQKQEVKEMLISFTEELEAIDRIWVCFQVLDSATYEILYQLYVLKKLYRETEKETGLNHRIFEETRKRGIQNILKMYQSEVTNLEIIRQRKTGKQEK